MDSRVRTLILLSNTMQTILSVPRGSNFSRRFPNPTIGNPTDNGTAPFATAADAMAVEPALAFPDYYLLTLGATGISSGLDTRFPPDLANDPFQITDYIPYLAYGGSPVHRFFQMWQQLDCSAAIPRPATRADALRTSSPGWR